MVFHIKYTFHPTCVKLNSRKNKEIAYAYENVLILFLAFLSHTNEFPDKGKLRRILLMDHSPG